MKHIRALTVLVIIMVCAFFLALKHQPKQQEYAVEIDETINTSEEEQFGSELMLETELEDDTYILQDYGTKLDSYKVMPYDMNQAVQAVPVE